MSSKPFSAHDGNITSPSKKTYFRPGEELPLTGPMHSLSERVREAENVLANHSGQFTQLSTAVSSVMSAFASWKTAVIGISSAVFSAIGVLVILQFNTAEEVGNIRQGLGEVSTQVDSVEAKVDSLPAVLSRDIIGLASEIANTRRQQE